MYSVSQELHDLMSEVISAHRNLAFIRDYSLNIVCQYSDKKRKSAGRVVFADTRKIPDVYKGLLGADFLITFYKPHSDLLDREQMQILMYHELRHVGYNAEREKCYIVPHEIEEFLDIIEEHGPEWCQVDLLED